MSWHVCTRRYADDLHSSWCLGGVELNPQFICLFQYLSFFLITLTLLFGLRTYETSLLVEESISDELPYSGKYVCVILPLLLNCFVIF